MVKKTSAFLCALMLACPRCTPAADFGAVTGGQFSAEDSGETVIKGGATLAPWLSAPIGGADLYISAGVTAGYDKKPVFVPELFRLEYSAKLSSRLFVRAGRIPWQDASRLAAKGSFDGADAAYDFGRFRLGGSVLYTGLLYKETANVNKSPGDPKVYSLQFDMSDFANTYFAPRRAIASLYGEFPNSPNERGNLHVGIMAQFDLCEAPEKYHTQYLLIRYSMIYKAFDILASGAVGLENTTAGGARASFAAAAEGGVQLPGALKDRLSFGARWASGSGPRTAAFFPLVRESQGQVLKPPLSGIMVLRANYEARPLPQLSAELRAKYFFRAGASSFADPDLENDEYPLGAEIAAGLFYVPFSDLSFTLSGGFFFPGAGRAMRGGTPARWALSLGTIFSF